MDKSPYRRANHDFVDIQDDGGKLICGDKLIPPQPRLVGFSHTCFMATTVVQVLLSPHNALSQVTKAVDPLSINAVNPRGSKGKQGYTCTEI